MTPSLAPHECPFCHKPIALMTSAKTGRQIRLETEPGPEGSFSVGYEPGRGRVARHVPRDLRTGALWIAHAQKCEAGKRAPRRQTPRTLSLGFASDQGTKAEVALAATQAHNAELQLERLADDLIKEWNDACKREGWRPVWTMLSGFLARRGGELPRQLRDKLSAVVTRKLWPAAAQAGARAHQQHARAVR